ncbi:ROK family transcriptional regulator [Rhodococcus triatomae]|nr:transcriptional repressor [Rhodococcus triatomae BKS 15-14]
MQGDRLLHRQRVVHLVRTSGPLARSDLARILGLGRSTITAIVSDLIADETLIELERHLEGASSRGRPRILLACNPQVRRVLGIWIDEMHARVVIADAAGNISEEGKTRTGLRNPASVIRSIVRICAPLLESPGGPVAAAGVCLPGFVDPASGTVEESDVLGWSKVALGEQLSRCLGIPTAVLNTTHALTLAEAIAGDAAGMHSAVVLDCGSPLGVGLIVDGRPHVGSTGVAGILGQSLALDTQDLECDEGLDVTVSPVSPATPPVMRDHLERAARVGVLAEALVDPELLIIAGLEPGRENAAALQSRINELRPEPRRNRTATLLSRIGPSHRVPVIVALRQLDEDIASLYRPPSSELSSTAT